MSWYTKPGQDNREKFAEEGGGGRQVWRFKVDVGQKRKVLFLADEMLGVWEHNVQMGNQWEIFTCSRDANCYHCGIGEKSSYAEYSTVLDLTPYTAKDGTQKKFSRKAFRAVGSALEILKRRRDSKGQKETREGKEVNTLTGFIMECARDSKLSPSCGNDFEVLEKVDLATRIPPEVNKPIQFEKMLAPLPAHVIQAKMKFRSTNIGTTKLPDAPQGEQSAPEQSDDIPF